MVARRWAFWPLLQVLHRARRMGLWAEIKPLLRDRLFPVRIAATKEGNPSPPPLFQMATGYWVSGQSTSPPNSVLPIYLKAAPSRVLR